MVCADGDLFEGSRWSSTLAKIELSVVYSRVTTQAPAFYPAVQVKSATMIFVGAYL